MNRSQRQYHLDVATGAQLLAHETWLVKGDSKFAAKLYALAREHLFLALDA